MISELANTMSRAALTAALIAALSCGQASKSQGDRKLDERTRQLEQFAAKRQAREKELASMNVTQLAQELRRESERGVEPFNSTAYKQLVSRGSQAAAELKTQLKEPNRSSFLGLLVLRQIDAGHYRELLPEVRVGTLVDALKSATYFNSWGLPHQYWEEAAKALIAEGEAARKPLMALLNDRRRAPMWGSEEVFESNRYGYRVCDYAWALLTAIGGQKVEIPAEPQARDKLIAEMARRR